MFPAKHEIVDYYKKVLEVNDKQGICCNTLFPQNQIPEELAIHSLSTLQPLSHYEIQDGDRILDIGCGAGADCFLAAHYGGPKTRIHGIDITEHLITRAINLKKKYRFQNIEFTAAPVPPLPYKSNYFDFVMMNYSFHLFADKLEILSEIDRALVSGGTVIIADNFSPKEHNSYQNIEDWFMFAGGSISTHDFKKTIEPTNLELVEFIQVNQTNQEEEREIIGYLICKKKL